MSHAGELSGAESIKGGQSRRSNARDLPSPAHFSPDRFLRKKEKILATLHCFRYGGKAGEVHVSAIPLTRLCVSFFFSVSNVQLQASFLHCR